MPSPAYSVELELAPPPGLAATGEHPHTRINAICALRDIVYERGECTPHRMDDEFLVRFLRARNFVPERAHRLLVNYYKFKAENPALYEGVYPLDLRRIGDANIIAVPPYRDQNGRRLLLYRIGCWNPKAIFVEELFKATLLALELGVLEPRVQVLGGIAIFDLENIGAQHVWEVTPAVAAKIVKLMVSSFPAVTHAIHVINHSWIVDKMYAIFKPLLNSRMTSRIYFHGNDMTSLHKHIHPDHLPRRYGGVWPDYPYTVWLESLRKNAQVAKEMISCGYKFREEELSPEVVVQLREEGVKLA